MSQIITFETKKQNAGILWDAMSKPQRANIYFKMLGKINHVYDPICVINFVNTPMSRMGGNTRKLTRIIYEMYEGEF